MGEVELDARLAWPLDPGHPERRPQQPVACGDTVFLWHAQHEERRVHEEDEGAAEPQEAGRFRDPARRVRPQARPVLGDGEIEARIGIRYLLGIAVDQRQREPGGPWSAGRRSCRSRPHAPRGGRATPQCTRCRSRARSRPCRRGPRGGHAAQSPAYARSPRLVPGEPRRAPPARRTLPRASQWTRLRRTCSGNSGSSFIIRLLQGEEIPRGWSRGCAAR